MQNVQTNNGITAQGAGDAVNNLPSEVRFELETAMDLLNSGNGEEAIECLSNLIEDYQMKSDDPYLISFATTSLLKFYSEMRYVRTCIESVRKVLSTMMCIKLAKGGEQ